MTDPPPKDLTLLLAASIDGDEGAREALVERTYEELKRIAGGQLHGDGTTLQPTMLVNEAWIRLFSALKVQPEHRGQFFALAAKVMRGLLIDHLRARRAQVRGGGRHMVTLTPDAALSDQGPIDTMDLCEALDELKTLDPEQHEVVELRFFAGLTMPEIATATARSLATVEREWRAARAWLAARLNPPE